MSLRVAVFGLLLGLTGWADPTEEAAPAPMHEPATTVLIPVAPIPAFPGAEGAGAMTPGGRGGQVLFVTNLEDYARNEPPIPGSLRAAVTTKGPRTVLFRVSGNIDLKAPLVIKEPFLTIAGQSAPGDGICLRNYAMVIRDTHDIVVRYLRFRPGDRVGVALAAQGKSWETDALSGTRCRRVIIDHCSASWANDECLSFTDCADITVQWCFITESMNVSTHPKGRHGYGGLVALIEDGAVTQHHNLWAYHFSRSPRPGSTENCQGPGLLYDFTNNVVYRGGQGYTAEGSDKIRMNYRGNTTEAGRALILTKGVQIFQHGNLLNGNDTGWGMILGKYTRAEMPFDTAPVTVEPADVAAERVLAEGGASLPKRDGVDARVVRQVRAKTGSLINSQNDVGGWPELATAPPPPDRDNDGMPDDWEIAHGLDPDDPSDNVKDANGNGYTNLEDWLNSIK